jgi:hypothetical protein
MAAPFSPPAIMHLFNRLRAEGYPNGVLSGISAPNVAFGYHLARNRARANDYSIQRPDDRLGDGWAASGLDMTLRQPADMARITQRLITLTQARDQRVMCLREFFGTVDGRNVTGLDVRDNRWVTSDPTHLWHIHISVYRRFATDHAAMSGVADAIVGRAVGGTPPTSPDWSDMATAAEVRAIIREELHGDPFRIVLRREAQLGSALTVGDANAGAVRTIVHAMVGNWLRSVEFSLIGRRDSHIGAAAALAEDAGKATQLEVAEEPTEHAPEDVPYEAAEPTAD